MKSTYINSETRFQVLLENKGNIDLLRLNSGLTFVDVTGNLENDVDRNFFCG